MRNYHTGEPVAYGVYASLRALDVCFVGADGESLEGRAQANYRRVPTLLMLLLAPLAGAVFVMAFPALVLGLVFVALARFVVNRIHLLMNRGVQLASGHVAGGHVAGGLHGRGNRHA